MRVTVIKLRVTWLKSIQVNVLFLLSWQLYSEEGGGTRG